MILRGVKNVLYWYCGQKRKGGNKI